MLLVFYTASWKANLEFLALLSVFAPFMANSKYDKMKGVWFQNAVMSDCPETVKALKTFFPGCNLGLTNVIKTAHERGNCEVIRSLDPKFNDDVMMIVILITF